MNQLWDEFWATGKVTDYLKYCNRQRENAEEIHKEDWGTSRDVASEGVTHKDSVTSKEYDGAGRDSDGHGSDIHVHRGL